MLLGNSNENTHNSKSHFVGKSSTGYNFFNLFVILSLPIHLKGQNNNASDHLFCWFESETIMKFPFSNHNLLLRAGDSQFSGVNS